MKGGCALKSVNLTDGIVIDVGSKYVSIAYVVDSREILFVNVSIQISNMDPYGYSNIPTGCYDASHNYKDERVLVDSDGEEGDVSLNHLVEAGQLYYSITTRSLRFWIRQNFIEELFGSLSDDKLFGHPPEIPAFFYDVLMTKPSLKDEVEGVKLSKGISAPDTSSREKLKFWNQRQTLTPTVWLSLLPTVMESCNAKIAEMNLSTTLVSKLNKNVLLLGGRSFFHEAEIKEILKRTLILPQKEDRIFAKVKGAQMMVNDHIDCSVALQDHKDITSRCLPKDIQSRKSYEPTVTTETAKSPKAEKCTIS